MADPSVAPLSHLRVLDLTSASADVCGKLLADLGALVIKVEPPGGDPARLDSPRLDCDSESVSARFLYGNTNKKSVILDLEVELDRDRFRTLAAEADLILESGRVGWLSRLGLGYEALSAEHPGLVMTAITGFGQTGPQSGYRSNDLVASALGGLMTSVGHPDDPPVRLAGHQADVVSALFAAASSLIALYHRDRTGVGQFVDVSRLEVIAAVTHIAGVGPWLEDGIIPKRVGTGLVASVPSGAYRCRDGLIYLMVNRPAHWEALSKWIHEVTGNEEVLMPEFHGASSSRLPFRELLDVFISDLAATFCVDEMVREGQSRHIAVTPVATAQRLLADAHLKARNFFIGLDLGAQGEVRMPGPPARIRAVDRSNRVRAARPGEHDGEFLAAGRKARDERPAGRATTTSGSAPHGMLDGALAGLRVVEFGAGLAAPWVGRILAAAGAEVIKVESLAFPDVPRLFVPPRQPELGRQPSNSPWFTDWSAGKRFVGLDLQNVEGAELARQIIDQSDAVIANYSVGVLDKLGLGFSVLKKRNPNLVMLESTGFGEEGPNKHFVTWGPNIEAASALASLGGFPDRECTISHFAYPDPLSAVHGLAVLMASLIDRQRSGRGRHIALSQLEATVAAIGPLMLEAAALGREPTRQGNGESGCAPYGCFPCRGEDRWCVVCVEDEADWARLTEVLGHPAWAMDARFATMEARVANAEALASHLSQWTRTRLDDEVMETLQRAGLAAGVVQNAEDLLRRDQQLAHRAFFEEIPHFKKGRVTASGIPLGLTATPGRTTHSGSSVGQDNHFVLTEILKIPQAAIDDLIARGVVEEDP